MKNSYIRTFELIVIVPIFFAALTFELNKRKYKLVKNVYKIQPYS